MSERKNAGIQKAWAFYDWANSTYALVISTAIFPIFYNAKTTADDGSTMVEFFGASFVNTELYSYVIAASLIMVIILSPMLSGIADVTGRKKLFLQLFCYIGSLGCAGLYFFDTAHLEWSMLGAFLASLGYWNSIVFYNAYLPEIAAPEDQDKLSAKGFVWGYVGSVLLLVINLVMIMVISDDLTPWAFIMVAVWWAGFAQITFRKLPRSSRQNAPRQAIWTKGFKELRSVWNQMQGMTRLKRYLLAFFVFSMAVQTIMLMAQFFGMKEVFVISDPSGVGHGVFPPLVQSSVGLETAQLIIAIILVQLIAIPGAWLFARGSASLGNINMLIIALMSWIAVCIFAFVVVDTPNEFFFAAGWIGFMMGGTQALSRSTYSKLLPETEDHTSFFSFYDVVEKIGIVIGMFSFGYIEGITGSMRNSVLSLIVFFTIGLLLLLWIPRQGGFTPQSSTST
ncbi:MFS transporter [Sanyastnella coralliicola]|uniref:MFS transporter n=1 Tax=Sanyastnella coralliicola TaxID=3069118 RepID=UPI0027B91B07|nr:MFS transporter [Longitalea sp. SCSIO 12813]